MISPRFLSDLRAAIAEEIQQEQARIAGGLAADWPDYRHRTGIVAGMKKADALINTLIEDKPST